LPTIRMHDGTLQYVVLIGGCAISMFFWLSSVHNEQSLKCDNNCHLQQYNRDCRGYLVLVSLEVSCRYEIKSTSCYRAALLAGVFETVAMKVLEKIYSSRPPS
jgi:hypothetical protein